MRILNCFTTSAELQQIQNPLSRTKKSDERCIKSEDKRKELKNYYCWRSCALLHIFVSLFFRRLHYWNLTVTHPTYYSGAFALPLPVTAFVVRRRTVMDDPPQPQHNPTQPPQHTPNPFLFRHPVVYCLCVAERVRPLEEYRDQDVLPKLHRGQHALRAIDQKQRTKSISSHKHKLQQQAWRWKRTATHQAVLRLEGFAALVDEFLQLAHHWNPTLLRLTVVWQRTQHPVCPHPYYDYVTDVQYRDYNYDAPTNTTAVAYVTRLASEYKQAYAENRRISQSIQHRMALLSDNAILQQFYETFCICATCHGMYHTDYEEALIIRSPPLRPTTTDDATTSTNNEEDCSQDTTTTNTTATQFMCIHCWNSRARYHADDPQPPKQQQTLPQKDNTIDPVIIQNQPQAPRRSTRQEESPTPTTTVTRRPELSSEVGSHKKPGRPSALSSSSLELELQKIKSATTTTTPKTLPKSSKKNDRFESARWKARRKVLQQRTRRRIQDDDNNDDKNDQDTAVVSSSATATATGRSSNKEIATVTASATATATRNNKEKRVSVASSSSCVSTTYTTGVTTIASASTSGNTTGRSTLQQQQEEADNNRNSSSRHQGRSGYYNNNNDDDNHSWNSFSARSRRSLQLLCSNTIEISDHVRGHGEWASLIGNSSTTSSFLTPIIHEQEEEDDDDDLFNFGDDDDNTNADAMTNDHTNHNPPGDSTNTAATARTKGTTIATPQANKNKKRTKQKHDSTTPTRSNSIRFEHSADDQSSVSSLYGQHCNSILADPVNDTAVAAAADEEDIFDFDDTATITTTTKMRMNEKIKHKTKQTQHRNKLYNYWSSTRFGASSEPSLSSSICSNSILESVIDDDAAPGGSILSSHHHNNKKQHQNTIGAKKGALSSPSSVVSLASSTSSPTKVEDFPFIASATTGAAAARPKKVRFWIPGEDTRIQNKIRKQISRCVAPHDDDAYIGCPPSSSASASSTVVKTILETSVDLTENHNPFYFCQCDSILEVLEPNRRS